MWACVWNNLVNINGILRDVYMNGRYDGVTQTRAHKRKSKKKKPCNADGKQQAYIEFLNEQHGYHY